MKYFFHIIILGLAFLCASAASAGGLQERSVFVKATGANRTEAVREGQRQALEQVRGFHIEYDDHTTSQFETGQDGPRVQNKSDREVKSTVSGTVKEYKILREGPSGDGAYEVEMNVVVVRYAPGPQSKRKRVAVMPFRCVDGQADAVFLEELRSGIGNYFTQTREFAVLDRQYLAEREAEFDFLAHEADIEERARIGNALGADYLVVGTLSLQQHERERIPYSTKTADRDRAVIQWNVIDVATGQVKAAGRQVENRIRRERSAELANTAGRNIASAITEIIYPIPVVLSCGEFVTIGRGSSCLRIGDRFDVLERTERISHSPYTQEAIGHELKRVGTVEIVDVFAKQAHAKVCEGELGESLPGRYVLRRMRVEEPPASGIRKINW